MTVTELEKFLQTAPADAILVQAELHKETFLAFLRSNGAGNALDKLLHKFGREWQAQMLEAVVSSIPKDEIQFLEKHELGLAFRTILLPSLPAHLLHFNRRFWSIPRVDPHTYKELLSEPDVEAAYSPESCFPLDVPANSDSEYHSQFLITTHLEEANEKAISTFVTELTWCGITPSIILDAVEFIQTTVLKALSNRKGAQKEGISLIFQNDIYSINNSRSLELIDQLSTHCKINAQIASRLLDWVINVARWKPFLFQMLEARPEEHGITLFYHEENHADVFDRWRFNAEKWKIYDPKEPEIQATASVIDILDEIKHTDQSWNKEDLLGFSYEIGRDRLFSAWK